MIECGAYILSNRAGTKFYIGSSHDLDSRLKEHLGELRRKVHKNSNLQQLWEEEGDLCMKRFITADREEAFQLEQDMMDYHQDNPGLLNIGKGVKGGDNLSRHPRREEIVKAITETLRQQVSEMTPEERKLRWGLPGKKNGMFGKTHTTQVRALLSSINVGNSYRTGHAMPESQRREISARQKLRTGEKNSFYGKSHTEETRKLIAQSRKGSIPSNATGVIVDDNLYRSFREAGDALGLNLHVVRFRALSKNPKFANYQLADKCPTTIEKQPVG